MTICPPLEIPETLAAGPGPGNTDPRVLERFAKTGVADHMQKDVLRGMIEAKEMLRELWGTKNVYTYGVGGTGFSAVDCVLSMILPRDKVVVFSNGTFSGIDGLTIRMKASTNEDLAADSFNPKPKNVITLKPRMASRSRPRSWIGHSPSTSRCGRLWPIGRPVPAVSMTSRALATAA
jgi:alanine-glyoxylate transaminase/serine-glyoxylate transaminase/serine-pyruvate transaminase